jgi:DNA-binding MurR/RpiR family transcriptional regulator
MLEVTDPGTVPKDFAGLKALIMARAPDLPKRLTQVASFALAHPDEIAFGTAASVAQQAEVQPSTLVRFSQALGYQGFSELQDVFRSRLRDRVLNYDERLAQLREHAASASKATVLFQGFAEASEKSLADLRVKIDQKALDDAVDLLAKAKVIYVVGLKRSFAVAAYISYAFSKLGVRHVLLDGLGGLAADSMNFAEPEDAMLAISFAPYAPETLGLAAMAAKRGMPVVAITDSAFSQLAQGATLWFEVNEANFEGFRSFAATFALAMALTVAIAEKR